MAGIISGLKDWLNPPSGEAVAPRQPQATGRVTSINRRRGGETGQIHTIDATSYADAIEIAALYREDISVIVNMAEMTEPESRRLLDFMLGLRHALQGDLQRVTPKVYLLAPHSVGTNNEEDDFEPAGDGLIINPAR